MLYIRTAENVAVPFAIPLWVKLVVAAFACYFVWITVEYFRYFWLVEEIQRLEASTAAKYMAAEQFDELTAQLKQTNEATDFVLETIERTDFDEPTTLR